MTHYLESLDTDEIAFKYDYFNENKIKIDLFEHFKNNPNDELWLYKVNNSTETVGDDFIAVFVLMGHNVCKEVYRGDRTFYKTINKPI